MQSLKSLSLNGPWQVRQAGSDESLPLSIPGEIHTALLQAGRIKDPFYRENERDQLWIAEKTWVFERSFDLSEEDLHYAEVLLDCESLDTFAHIEINGKSVARTRNMFRHYTWPVRHLLQPGENRIHITFSPVWPSIREKWKQKEHFQTYHVPWEEGGRSLVRKEQCNFGWDWGPVCVTCGIRRDIRLVAFDGVRLEPPRVRQTHTDGRVEIEIELGLNQPAEEAAAVVILSQDGRPVAKAGTGFDGQQATTRLVVENPRLWWPAGMGEQPLYDLHLSLQIGDRQIDEWRQRLGLRDLRLVREPDEWGESFVFEANGQRFFAKGANWIPSDVFHNRTGTETLRHLLQSARDANMNLIRVWGGGIYESDTFYDLCDELGLCVWQDFMFACASYPADDPAFMEEVRAEVADQVKRLRNRTSLALWCGNNELEAFCLGDPPKMPWDLYLELFDREIPAILKELDPDRSYWPGSPSSTIGDRRNADDPRSGDAHYWGVWHGKEPFESFRDCAFRFCSEFGFQSYPEPATVETFTLPEDRRLNSPVMEHHQRSSDGNAKIMHYMLDWFAPPDSFGHALWLSQIQQGLAIKYAVEHWRRNWPRCGGAVYWQLNDVWPVASWSSIDYFGRWKALHYFARRFFAPVLLSGVESLEDERASVAVHLSCDQCEETEGRILWELSDTAGGKISAGEIPATLQPWQSRCVKTLDFSREINEFTARERLLWLSLEVNGETVASDLVTFLRPKSLSLMKPEFRFAVEETDRGFAVTLETDRPALWVWPIVEDRDCLWSDSFFPMKAGGRVEITTPHRDGLNRQDLLDHLRFQSIRDTYS